MRHFIEGRRVMAQYNLQGRWTGGGFEQNIVMTSGGAFNVKAITEELKKHWVAGYGEVFDSGKFEVTLSGGAVGDIHLTGSVTANGKQMHFSNNQVWTLLPP
jgi:hypothetical protein